MNTLSPAPSWCTFENLPTGPKAVSATASCAFSLSTLEIAITEGSKNFAVIERKQPDIWRWAIIGEGDRVIFEGFESNRDDAKSAAIGALQGLESLETP